MAQTGPRAQSTPGRTHHQSKGSCLYLLGRPQVPTSLGPLAPLARRGHGSVLGRAPSPFPLPPARTRSRSGAASRQRWTAGGGGVRWPGQAPPPRPAPPALRARLRVPASLLRRLLPAAAAVAAREAMEAGAEAGAGAEGWSCPGQSRPSLTSPPPLLPLLHLSSLQTPTSSPPPLLPPSPPKSSSLRPAPHPGPVSIFPAEPSATGCILSASSFPEPSPSRLSSPGRSRPCTPEGSLAQGEGGAGEVQGENGGEGSGSGSDPFPQRLLPITTCLSFHAPPHPFSRFFTSFCPLSHPFPFPPVPSRLKRHTPLPSVQGRGALNGGC